MTFKEINMEMKSYLEPCEIILQSLEPGMTFGLPLIAYYAEDLENL